MRRTILTASLAIIFAAIPILREWPVVVLHAAAAHIASAHAASPGSGGGTTAAINTTGATLLTVICHYTSTAPTVSDSASNTWTNLTASTQGSGIVRISYVNSATPNTSATHTFSCLGTGVYSSVTARAFSGTAASPFDQQATNNTGGSSVTSLTTGSVTPTDSGQVLIAGIEHGAIVGSLSINSSFLDVVWSVFSSGVSVGGGGAYLIHTSGAINPTWSWTTSRSEVSTAIATFKAAAAGGVTPKGLLMGILP